MGKIIFILGGARSGKSSHSLKLAGAVRGRAAFVATCAPLDKEMEKRIEKHKSSRPLNWQTFEERRNLPALMAKIGSKFRVIIVDCLTLYLTNLLLAGLDEAAIERNIGQLLQTVKAVKSKTLIVSNEVGLGIVPQNRLARKFRDLAGRINQIVAEKSDEVIFMVSGLPIKVK
ncbi:MAG: bifunctional adenosylcobinamide kinase/adenosylcobinamide-phosphate guanylyltransferase [Elusimicrobiota bacterium]